MTPTRPLSILRIATLAIATIACDPPREANPTPAAVDSTDIEAVTEELQRQRAAWDAEDLAHYRYTYIPRCFCPPARIVIEVDATGARVIGSSGDSIAVARHIDQGIPTIDSLFARLARTAADDPAEMRVRYDSARHHPVESWIDVDRMMADEEYGFEVDSLVVLGEGGQRLRPTVESSTTVLVRSAR